MVLDLVFFGILALFFGLGLWRGAIASVSGLVCLALGYVGAVVAATQAGGQAARLLDTPPLLGPAAAGTIGFAVVYLIASAGGAVVHAWDKSRTEHTGRGPIDRGLGAFFGVLRGGLVVVLLSVLMTWLDAARDLKAVAGLDALPQTETSTVSSAAGALVQRAVTSAVGGDDAGDAGRVAGRLAGNPAAFLTGVQGILDDPGFSAVVDDRFFWTLVANGAGDRAINQQAFYNMSKDPEMRRRFAALGLVPESAVADAQEFRREFAVVLDDVGKRVEGLKDDPELLALAEDPEIQALLQAGDSLALLQHPKILRLASRLAGEPQA